MEQDQRLSVTDDGARGTEIRVFDAGGTLTKHRSLEPDASRRAHQAKLNGMFKELRFAAPRIP